MWGMGVGGKGGEGEREPKGVRQRWRERVRK